MHNSDVLCLLIQHHDSDDRRVYIYFLSIFFNMKSLRKFFFKNWTEDIYRLVYTIFGTEVYTPDFNIRLGYVCYCEADPHLVDLSDLLVCNTGIDSHASVSNHNTNLNHLTGILCNYIYLYVNVFFHIMVFLFVELYFKCSTTHLVFYGIF